MRKSNTQSLGDAIQMYLRAIGAEQKIKEIRVLGYWDEIVGKAVSNATLDISIKSGVLYVQFNSALIKNHIWMQKTEIINLLNAKAGEEIIKSMYIK